MAAKKPTIKNSKDAGKPETAHPATPKEIAFIPAAVPPEFLAPGAKADGNRVMLRIPGMSSLIGTLTEDKAGKQFHVYAATYNDGTDFSVLAPLDTVALRIYGDPEKVDLNNAALIAAWKKGEDFAVKYTREDLAKQHAAQKAAVALVPLHLMGGTPQTYKGEMLEYIELPDPKDKKHPQALLGHVINNRIVDIEGALYSETTKDGQPVVVPVLFDKTVTLNIAGRDQRPPNITEGKIDRADAHLQAAYAKAKNSITEDMRQAYYEKAQAGFKLPTHAPGEMETLGILLPPLPPAASKTTTPPAHTKPPKGR